MGEVKQPERALLFVGLLIAPTCPLHTVHQALQSRLGPMVLKSELMEFNFTRYYEPEMGTPLSRQFVAFRDLVVPDEVPGIKITTNRLETELALDGKRRVNIDPGYITGAKLVLVTTKDHAHRLYLSHGIYGEITLMFQRGKFEALPWTYPDYRSEPYQRFFSELRKRYLAMVAVTSPSDKMAGPI